MKLSSAAAMAHSVADALEVLGLSADQASSRALLRKSYRAAVLKHHPDKNPGDPDAAARFRAACAAYSVLEKRATGGGSADVELSEAARRGADSAEAAPLDELERLFEKMSECIARVQSLRTEIDTMQTECDAMAQGVERAMAPMRGDPRARRASLEAEARDDLAMAKLRARRRARQVARAK